MISNISENKNYCQHRVAEFELFIIITYNYNL